MTPMVKQLLIINILVYLAANFLAPVVSYDMLSLHFPLNEKFEWWQILTHIFMHAEIDINYMYENSKIDFRIMHIVFNMFGLVMFGSSLEHFWGGKKFLVFYLLSGIGAALLYMGINYFQYESMYNEMLNVGYTINDINYLLQSRNKFSSIYHGSAVGASGALYGILVAFAFMFPNVELMLMFIPVPIKAKYFVPAIVFFDLFAGLNGNSVFGYTTGIAHFAHFGGALTGFLLMLYFKKTQFDKNRWH